MLRALTFTERLKYIPGLRFQPKAKNLEFCRSEGEVLHVPLWYAIHRLQQEPPVRQRIRLALREHVTLRRGDHAHDQKTMIDEATAILDKERSVLLHIPTGRGKTLMAIYLSCHYSLLTFVMCKKALMPHWKKKVEESTTGSCWMIGKKPPKTFTHIICTPDTVKKVPEEYLNAIGLLIIDEIHQYYTQNRLRAITLLHPAYVIACSATPEKGEKGLHATLDVLVGSGNVVFRDEDDPYTFVRLDTGLDLVEDMGGNGNANPWGSLLGAQGASAERNQMVLDLVQKYPNDKFLIFTWLYKDHVPAIVGLLAQHGVDHAYYAQSQTEYNDSRVVVTTISKSSDGMDQEAVCANFDGRRFDKMIMMGTVKSIGLFVQMKGRLVGRSDNPVIFCLVDRAGSSLRHARKIAAHVKKNKNTKYVDARMGQPLPDFATLEPGVHIILDEEDDDEDEDDEEDNSASFED